MFNSFIVGSSFDDILDTELCDSIMLLHDLDDDDDDADESCCCCRGGIP